MILLLLIRHAATESTGRHLSGRTPGLHLSERGREQAAALGSRLRPLPIAALYCSPLERCVETAEYVARERRLNIAPLSEVVEVDYGRWTGRSIGQVARTRLWRLVQSVPSTATFPGGESLEEVQRRSVRALDGLAARHAGKVVAVVTHAEVIRLAVAHYAGVHLDLFQRLVIAPASVTALMTGDGTPSILRMNETGTLEDLAPRRERRRRGGPG